MAGGLQLLWNWKLTGSIKLPPYGSVLLVGEISRSRRTILFTGEIGDAEIEIAGKIAFEQNTFSGPDFGVKWAY